MFTDSLGSLVYISIFLQICIWASGNSNYDLDWAIQFEFHTPPVEDLRKHHPQGSVNSLAYLALFDKIWEENNKGNRSDLLTPV